MAFDLLSPLKDVNDPGGMYSSLKSRISMLDKDIGIPYLAQTNIPSYDRIKYSFPEQKLKDLRHGQFREGGSMSEDVTVEQTTVDALLSECYIGNLDKVLFLHRLNPEIVHSYDILKRTPLHYVALGKGSTDIAKFLIHSGVKLDAKNLNGDTAFNIACFQGHLELVKFLHKKDDSLIQSCNNNNLTALHQVALGGSGSVEVADYLINEGADIQARDDEGSTVFHIACQQGHLNLVEFLYMKDPSLISNLNNKHRTPLHYVAVGTGSVDVASYLLKHGANLHIEDTDGNTVLHIACHQGYFNLVEILYKNYPYLRRELNKKNKKKQTPLHYVAMGTGSVDVASYLLEHGADLHIKDADGNTVLHIACYQGYFNLVEILYEEYPYLGCELNKKNKKKQTPLHYVAMGTGSVDVASYLLEHGAKSHIKDADGNTVLHIACHQGYFNLVEILYKNYPYLGCELNKKNKKKQTPLHYVAMGTGSVDVASYLLKHGADLHIKDADGNTVLHIACYQGYFNLVEILYENYPYLGCELNKKNKKKQTPLHYVAMGTGSVDVASYLLKHGADIHIKDADGNTVLHIACYQGYFNLVEIFYKNYPYLGWELNKKNQTPLHYVAMGTGSVDVASYLLKHWAKSHIKDADGNTVLHMACHQGHSNLVEFLYKRDPSLIRELNNKQQTPLHYVAMGTGSVDVASYLLEHGADLHIEDTDGNTVLHIACHQGHLNLVEILYKNYPYLRCEINKKNKKKQTPLHYVAMGTGSVDVASYLLEHGADLHIEDTDGNTVLHIACHQGYFNLVKFLYKNYPYLRCEINKKNQTPLHCVAMGTGSVGVASYLLKHGADIHIKDADGNTVFHMACHQGHSNLVEFLYKRDPSLIRELNNKQQTPLHYVAMGTGSVDVASYLLKHGADLHIKDTDGNTVLHIACHQGHLNLVEILYKNYPYLRCEINKKNKKKQTPLHYVAMGTGSVDVASYLLEHGADLHIEDTDGNTVLHIACHQGYFNLVKFLYKNYPYLRCEINKKNQTPLHYVAMGTGSVHVASYLLKNGTNIHQRDAAGSTVFHMACHQGHLNLVEFLYKRDPSLKSKLNNKHQTPLHYVAIGTGSVDVASYLLKNGADINERDEQGSTVFHMACQKGHLNLVEFLYKRDPSLISKSNNKQERPLYYVAMGTGSVDVASYLLKNGAAIHERDYQGSTVFHIACLRGHLNLVEFLYKKDPSLIRELNNTMQTPLHYVAMGTGSVDVASYLLKNGADIHAKDEDGDSVCHIACHEGHLKLLKFLHNKYPMLIKTKNKEGFTCLDHVAKCTSPPENVVDFLIHQDPGLLDTVQLAEGSETSKLAKVIQKIFYKAIIGCEYKLIRGLTESGVDVNEPSEEGTCPIHYAAETGHVKIIQVLIDHGCALDAQDNQGQTALHITCRNEYLDATKLLISNGANLVLKDKEGKDALIYAIENNRLETVSFLLGQNIDLVTDKQGKTPLQYAIETRKNGLISLLAQYEHERSKEDVYIENMELAIATDCSCLGEFTTQAMLQDYFTQDKSTSEKSSISHIAVQVLKLLCTQLQAKIPKQFLVKVWPVYENSKHGPVSLIVYVTDIPDIKIKSLFGLEVIYRLYNFVNEEESVVIHSDLEKNNPILGEDLKKIIGIIDENALELSANHSNLTKISCSPVKSRNLGTSLTPEHSIVLYCRHKGKIPFGEREFPPEIGQFSTDVREGYVSLNSNVNNQQKNLPANDRHDTLRMGCSISRQCSNLSGTLGAFIDWKDKVHFITCAHVLFSSTECMTEDGIVDINDAGTAIQVCQPGDGDAGSGRYTPTERLSGKVKKACFNPPDREVSVDAALVEITDARAPAVSEFIGIDKQDMKECGFDEVPDMSQMSVFNFNPYEESNLDCRLFKVGAKTGMTRGVLRLNGTQAFITHTHTVPVNFPDRVQAVNIRKQITVLGVQSNFFMRGDSGALVFIRKNGENYCLGLAIASDPSTGECLVTPITEVLDALNLREENLLGYTPYKEP